MVSRRQGGGCRRFFVRAGREDTLAPQAEKGRGWFRRTARGKSSRFCRHGCSRPLRFCRLCSRGWCRKVCPVCAVRAGGPHGVQTGCLSLSPTEIRKSRRRLSSILCDPGGYVCLSGTDRMHRKCVVSTRCTTPKKSYRRPGEWGDSTHDCLCWATGPPTAHLFYLERVVLALGVLLQ